MNRRKILQAAAAAPALFGLPAAANSSPPALPDAKLLTTAPEKFWTRIRQNQFLLPGWRAFLNNGSLGVAPRAVVQAVTDYLQRSAALEMDDYPRWGYETLDGHRAEMAAFLGCRKEELAFTHNATEAMNIIAGGLDLKPGDEVVLTDQEHPSGRAPWQLKQKRYGIALREVPIPLPPKNSAQLADLMISAIGPRTRVLSFSGITTTTGLIMPVREICAAARAKGVLTVVDGAHMNGQIALRIGDLGCDYFAGSPHKWLFAPAGCGILYMREEHIDRHWPGVVTGAWDDRSIGVARFMQMGTNNRALFEGMIAGKRFAERLGPERIHARIHQLAQQVRARAASVPYLELLTPADDTMYGALVTFQFRDRDPKPLFALLRKKRIWTMINPRLRMSTHIHTRPSDLDVFFEAMRETMG